MDLVAKLLASFVISVSDTWSRPLTIWAVMGANTASIFAEFYATRRIYASIPELATRSSASERANLDDETDVQPRITQSPVSPDAPAETNSWLAWLHPAISPWTEYISSPVFLASFSKAILHWTVLYFGGQMITYLLNTGFLPLEISIFRIASVLAELGGTWAAPIMMQRIGPVRAALWFLMWQVACIGVIGHTIVSGDIMSKAVGITLAVGITFKRLGLWGSDLAIQFLVQEVSP